MATLTVQDITDVGVAFTTTAAAGGGDAFANSEGRTTFLCLNQSGGALTVTIATAATDPTTGLAIADVSLSVPNGSWAFFGPFPSGLYNDTNGLIQVTYSGVTSLTVAALNFPTRKNRQRPPRTGTTAGTLTVAQVTSTGITIPTFQSATPSADTFLNGEDEKTILFMLNNSGGSITLTVSPQQGDPVEGRTVADRTLVTAGSTYYMMGGFPAHPYNDASGLVHLAYSSATNFLVYPVNLGL